MSLDSTYTDSSVQSASQSQSSASPSASPTAELYAQRDENLRQLSTMMLGTLATTKLDLIATVGFYGTTFFNVFRRYNSVYEIVFEDVNGDMFVQKDFTIRQSLQQLLCLTDAQMHNIYTINLVSMKHNAPPPSIPFHLLDMRWSAIQREWAAIGVHFGGVMEQYNVGRVSYQTPAKQNTVVIPNADILNADTPHMLHAQARAPNADTPHMLHAPARAPNAFVPPNAPKKESNPKESVMDLKEEATILADQIMENLMEKYDFHGALVQEGKEATARRLLERFEAAKDRKRTFTQMEDSDCDEECDEGCDEEAGSEAGSEAEEDEMEEEDEEEEEEEEEEDEDEEDEEEEEEDEE